jgi:hypothetical protein
MPDPDPLLSEAAAAATRAKSQRRSSNTKRTPPEPDTPPKETPPKSKGERKTTLNPDGKRTPKWAKLESELAQMYSALALPFAAMGDDFCASHLASNAESLASSWVDLAQQNPNVEKVLQSLVTGGAWGGVIMTHAFVALPIAAHHNLIPGPAGQRIGMMFGLTPTDPNANGAQAAGHTHN